MLKANSGPFDTGTLCVPRERGGSRKPPGTGERQAVNSEEKPNVGLWGPDGSETTDENAGAGYGLAPGEGRRLPADDPNAVGHYFPAYPRPRQDGR